MTKYNALYGFPGGFKVEGSEPIDDRFIVSKKTDLYDISTFGGRIYKGMFVCVCDDTADNNGLYILIDVNNVGNAAGWIRDTVTISWADIPPSTT